MAALALRKWNGLVDYTDGEEMPKLHVRSWRINWGDAPGTAVRAGPLPAVTEHHVGAGSNDRRITYDCFSRCGAPKFGAASQRQGPRYLGAIRNDVLD